MSWWRNDQGGKEMRKSSNVTVWIFKRARRERVMREGGLWYEKQNNSKKGQNNIYSLKWFTANALVDCDWCSVSHQTVMRIHLGVIKHRRSPPHTHTPKKHTLQAWLVWSAWATHSLGGRAAGIITDNDTSNDRGVKIYASHDWGVGGGVYVCNGCRFVKRGDSDGSTGHVWAAVMDVGGTVISKAFQGQHDRLL